MSGISARPPLFPYFQSHVAPLGRLGIRVSSATECGVKAIQRRENLTVDGMVGPETQAVLDEKNPLEPENDEDPPSLAQLPLSRPS